MRPRRRNLTVILLVVAVSLQGLRADPGDVQNSHDYPGFARLPGYVITDYDEDNPADFTFAVARPLPIDSNHVEMVTAKGHRYVIRYELGSDARAPSLLQAQLYYEKLATDTGFTVEKTGAVGDASETFHLAKGGRDIWISLLPSITVNIVTIVDSKSAPAPPATLAESSLTAAPAPAFISPSPNVDDDFYTILMKDGRVVLPLTFLPGKPDLDADSQPVIDRVVAMLKMHPDLQLEIDGHTDNTGDPQSNQDLSRERAMTVRAMIIAAHIERKRLSAVGLGGKQPVADEHTAEGRQQNRRIELVFKKNASQKEVSPPKDTALENISPDDTTGPENPSFHEAAPNGTNYYPKTDTSSSSASPPSHSSR